MDLALDAAFSLLLGLFPLYCRITRDEMLDHPTRDRIWDAIRANAGLCRADLQRRLDVPPATLHHHLRTLEAHGLVRGVRDGSRMRYHIRGPRVDLRPYLTATDQGLLAAIASRPDGTPMELARDLGLPRCIVYFHARRLRRYGVVVARRVGRVLRLSAVAEASREGQMGAFMSPPHHSAPAAAEVEA